MDIAELLLRARTPWKFYHQMAREIVAVKVNEQRSWFLKCGQSVSAFRRTKCEMRLFINVHLLWTWETVKGMELLVKYVISGQ